MEIPYAVQPRPDTGLANAKLGVWLFLASEVMLFGALFSTYLLLRVAAPTWPPAWPEEGHLLNVPLGTVNTIILIASSVTMVLAWASLKMKNLRSFGINLGLTIFFALAFMVIKYFEYSAKFHHGDFPSTSTFFAIYFTLTGLHGLHVLGGVIVNSYLLGQGLCTRMFEKEPERFTNRVEVAGLYWHFVDLVWIFLFPSLYLL